MQTRVEYEGIVCVLFCWGDINFWADFMVICFIQQPFQVSPHTIDFLVCLHLNIRHELAISVWIDKEIILTAT